MYSRFGMTHIAVEAAQARIRAAQLQQQNNQRPQPRAAVYPKPDTDEAGALWRMAAVIAVLLALAGTVAWLV